MSEVRNEAAAQVYGDSWGSFLESVSEPSTDQPEMESEDVAEEPQGNEPQLEPVEDEEEPETEGDEPDAVDEPEVDEDPDIDMGDGKKAVKMSELKAGYLRQSDYTKKTQELADQRKELDAQRESLTAAQGFKDHMEANPWLWEQVNRALQEFESTGVLPIEEVLQDAQYGKYVNHLLAENNKLKTQLDGVQSEYEGVKLSSSMSELRTALKADYGDLVTDEYMTKLQDRAKSEKLSLDTLKEIAEGQLAKQSLGKNKKDVTTAAKKAEAKAIQKLAETKRVAPTPPKNTGARPAKAATSEGGSWGDFFKSITD